MVEIIGLGSERDPLALKLYTRKHRFIENEMPEYEKNPAALRAGQQSWQCHFDGRLKCRSLTALYNCAGMVFASRRTCVKNMRDVDVILVDDSYHRVPSLQDVHVGDVVVYRRDEAPQHVGIVFEKDPVVGAAMEPFQFCILSQWGEVGEYFHALRDVPSIYGDQIEFWSDRK